MGTCNQFLVGMNGSINFLCYPDFDLPTILAALLDDKKGGRFEIRPQLANVCVCQLYLPDTNILLTRFLLYEGVAELTDYMSIEKYEAQPNDIVRRVSVIRRNVQLKLICQPRFDHAAAKHTLKMPDRCAKFFPVDSPSSPMSLYSGLSVT